MKIVDRYQKRTPKFFKKLRNIGLALATAGGVILASPIALPAVIISIGGYLTVAGSVASTVSQAVVEGGLPNKFGINF